MTSTTAARTIRGIVIRVIRHGTSRNGNPRMSVELSTPTQGFDGIATLRLQDDAGLAYEIENPEFADMPHTFKLSRAGRIEYAYPEALDLLAVMGSAR